MLENAGAVSMEVAKRLAEERYETYNRQRLLHEAEAENIEDIKKLESYHE